MSAKQWFTVTKHLSLGKKIIVAILFLVVIGATALWLRTLYFHFSVAAVDRGGQYVEALVNPPVYINPLLAPRSRLTDKVLSRVIFSNLFAYDNQAQLKPDLAESFERSEDGKIYTVQLRRDVFWHDGEAFTADDVMQTIDIIRDGAYVAAGVPKGLQLAWRDVTATKVDDFTVTFELAKPRVDFLHSLTFGVLPEHRWNGITAEQFQLTELNRKPLGTGPYEFVESVVDEEGNVTEYTLRAYDLYHKGEPLITKMIFKFFPDRSTAIQAYKSGTVSGIVVDKTEQVESLEEEERSSAFNTLSLPSYFAVFLNQTQSVPLAFDEVREALTFAVNRDEIVEEIFKSIAQPVSSPFLPGMRGYSEEAQQPKFSIEEAVKKLEDQGWKVGDDGVRSKGEQKLSFELSVNPKNQQIVTLAELLKEQWSEIGAEVIIKADDENLGDNVIRPRAYDAIIEAHPMRWDQPQLLSLWHSNAKDDPGQNLSLLEDKELDTALTNLKTEADLEKRSELYSQIQKRILVEDPAVFLFAPGFVFVHSEELKNINVERANTPQDRFTNVHEWSIKEKRIFRK